MERRMRNESSQVLRQKFMFETKIEGSDTQPDEHTRKYLQEARRLKRRLNWMEKNKLPRIGNFYDAKGKIDKPLNSQVSIQKVYVEVKPLAQKIMIANEEKQKKFRIKTSIEPMLDSLLSSPYYSNIQSLSTQRFLQNTNKGRSKFLKSQTSRESSKRNNEDLYPVSYTHLTLPTIYSV
eukprot:TRINITY_DN22344_c0_g1_i1.p1 TRINITY_DN22344_c0_g1~~TRINITY_DN22344_c0_g1_i1.p1  ORF type:complete len:179 (-),score=30.59 TRINITY_DN22344_c0_g1_i1:33-569(-)